jgi:glutathione S-transferase
MKLYYLKGACSLAPHIVLEWIGQPYEAIEVPRDQLKSPEYLAINPAGAVPALDDGGWILTENVAVLGYLADLNPQLKLAGDGSPRSRAEVMRWLGFLNSDLHKAFVPLFRPAAFIDDEAQFEAVKVRARTNVRTLLERVERQLQGRDFLTGASRSIADPYLYVILRWAGGQSIDLDGLAALAAFRTRMEGDPGVRAALAAQGLT